MENDAKIIIAYSNTGKTAEIIKTIIQDNYLKVVACLNTGEKVMQLVKRHNPEFLVIDSALAGVNGLDILRDLVLSLEKRPFVIMYCEEENDIYWQLALKYKADLVLQKPVNPTYLLQQIHKVIRYGLKRTDEPISYVRTDIELEKKVTIVLHTLGLPARFKGFHYLRFALLLVAQDTDKIFSVTKILYPQVGEKFGVSGRSVEHSIATAIQCIWNSERKNNLKEVLGCDINLINSPTNVEFISLLSDTIRLSMF